MFLITTSRTPDPDLENLSYNLESSLPFSQYVRRGKKSLKDLSGMAYNNGFKGFIKVVKPYNLTFYEINPHRQYNTKGELFLKDLKVVNEVKALSPELNLLGKDDTDLKKVISRYFDLSMANKGREGNYMEVEDPEVRIFIAEELCSIINVEGWEDL